MIKEEQRIDSVINCHQNGYFKLQYICGRKFGQFYSDRKLLALLDARLIKGKAFLDKFNNFLSNFGYLDFLLYNPLKV